MVAAVWFDPAALPPDLLARLDDSKRLKQPLREALTPLIRAHARVAVAAGSRDLVDRITCGAPPSTRCAVPSSSSGSRRPYWSTGAIRCRA